MATPLNLFLAKLSTNTVRSTNMFEMFATSGYADIDNVLQYITMYGHGLTVPSRTVNYASVSFKGFEVGNAVATTMSMENEHTMTVNADVDGEIRRAFLAWLGKTMDPAISDGSVFAGDRRLNNSSVLRIHLLDNNNNDVTEVYKFINVKIMTVGSMNVSNVGGEVATFDVTFKSTYWEIENSTAGAFIGQK